MVFFNMMTHWMRSRFGLAIVVLAPVIVGASGHLAVGQLESLGERTTIEMVRDTSGIRLSVPTTYLKYPWDKHNEHLDSFILEAIYPDMTPVSMTDRNRLQEEMRSPNAHRFLIRIRIQPTKPGVVERLMDHYVLDLPQVSDASSFEEQDFIVYQSAGPHARRDYLVPRERFRSKDIFFDCISLAGLRPQLREHIGCTASIQYGDRLLVEYTYRRANLDKWQDVDGRVRGFVKQLVAACFEVSDPSSSESRQYHPCPF